MYLDSAYSRTSVVDQLMGEWERTIQANETDFLCGIIGPIEARANEGASTLAEMYGIPQLAYATIDRRLSRSQDFPNFRRIIPRGEDYAATIAEYIQRDIWKRDYIGIVYDQSDYGELFEDPLEGKIILFACVCRRVTLLHFMSASSNRIFPLKSSQKTRKTLWNLNP